MEPPLTARTAHSIAAACLALTALAGLLENVAPLPAVRAVATVTLVVYLALEWRWIGLNGQIIAALAVAATGLLGITGHLDAEGVSTAAGRAAFFAFFLVSLGFLREAARTSPMVRRCGRLLVRQPPSRRYLMLTAGGHVLGVLLHLGALGLLGSMIRSTAVAGLAEAEARRRGMGVAMLRGFSSTSFWSPTSMGVAVMVAGLPGLEWQSLLLPGGAAVLSFTALGLMMERWRQGPPTGAENDEMPAPAGLATVLPLVAMVGGLGVAAAALAWLSALPLLVSLLVCMPPLGAVWISVQFIRAGGLAALRLTVRRLVRRVPEMLPSYRSEIAVLSGAAFIGALVGGAVDVEFLVHWTENAHWGPAALLIAVSWAILLLSMIGLNPLVTLTVSVMVLGQMPMFQDSPLVVALSLMATWAVAAAASPMTASVLVAARAMGVKPSQLGPRWNGPFGLVAMLAMNAVLLLAT